MQAPDAGALARMAQALEHRGPDDQGVHCGEHWGLASRRLAIIGVDSGHQPLSNENGTVWVAFNGEIYNHHELRNGLVQRGHVLSSASDTEVLVHLYEDYGDAMVSRLQGMFAFAIVDTRRRRLLLARDRLGQKPLVYHIGPHGTLSFASELQALWTQPGICNALDPRALQDYFAFGYIPAPRTIFQQVRKLPPGCILTLAFGNDEPDITRYWHPCFEPKQDLSFRDAAAQTRQLLEDAVACRLESEVPLGAFLSGGIDSTAIVAVMQQMLDRPVHTFTIGFDEARYDERDAARLAAEHIGTIHASGVANPTDSGLLRALIRHCGEPFCDSSILPTALLSQFTQQSVTVALSGDGGDELFGGYERYRVMALHRIVSHLPSGLREALAETALAILPTHRRQRTALATIRRLIQALGGEPLPSYMGFQGIFSADARAELLKNTDGDNRVDAPAQAWAERLAEGTADDAVEMLMELDMMEYLPGDLLCKVDIASMMTSLEVRSPFLDHQLVDFVCALPRRYKVGLRHRKRLLAEAVRDLVPEATLRRPKRGFGVPVSTWLRGELADTVREMVFWQDEWDRDGLLDRALLRRLAEEHLNQTRDHSFQLWAVLCLKLWIDDVYKPLH